MSHTSNTLLNGLAVASTLSLLTGQAPGAEVLWSAPGTRVCIVAGEDPLEFENPLSGDETALGYPILQWRDADYAPGAPGEPAWYDDWLVNDDAIDGDPDQIWMRQAGQQIYTTTTVPSSVVSVHLVGDDDDGLADIYVDGSVVAQLDMGTARVAARVCCLITALPYSSHTVEVFAMGAGQTGGDDVATMGAAVLAGPKWTQGPDLDPTGIDVSSTHWPTPEDGRVLADDFPCTSPGALTAIRFWGSWYGDQLPFGNDPTAVSFTLSIHGDIPDPDGPGPAYSMPGVPLWTHTYQPDECIAVLYREDIDAGWLVPPDVYESLADTQCWQYECPGPDPAEFMQEGTPTLPLVYWLGLQAAIPEDPDAVFGWRTSPDHWNDDAVWAPGESPPDPLAWDELQYPPEHPLTTHPIDLAFEVWGDEAPPANGVVCEPQPPDHPGEYWYTVTNPNEWCSFNVHVYDPNPCNYSDWNVPPGWVFAVHLVYGDFGPEWFASWWDPIEGCPNAISGTFTFRFTNANPSVWSGWEVTAGNSPDPYSNVVDCYTLHTAEPNGYGYQVHVPSDPEAEPCCLTSNPPARPPGEPGCQKNRYISVVPQNPSQLTALRVTHVPTGLQWWVGPANDVTEASGSDGDSPEPTFKAARLQCEPYCAARTPEAVHISGQQIVPGGEGDYIVQAIDCICDLGIEDSYSEAASVDAISWGDVVGDFVAGQWTPPNGAVDFIDISAVVDKFRNLPSAPCKARVDVASEIPDRVIDFVDISAVVDAFRGLPYPYRAPIECP